MAEKIDIWIALREVQKYISDAKKAEKATTGVGDATEKAGKKAKISWGGVAKWAGGAAAIYGAQRFIRGAVSATEDLGKSTLALHRTTGLEVQRASQWAGVLKVRGVQANMFQRGLVKLSQTIKGAQDGGKKQIQMFKELGVSMDLVRSGDVESVLLAASDGLKGMVDPSRRAAIAQSLFGRQAIQLAPLLFKGSEAINEQLDIAKKYGVQLGTNNVKDIQEMIQHERELKLATLGVKIQMGKALMPVLLAISGILVTLAQVMSPLTNNTIALKIAIAALTATFILYKIAMIAATIATTVFEAAALPVVGIVLAIVVGLALLGVGIYLLIKHWGWLKAKMMDVWGWIKKNWPLLLGILLGPFALATVLIIRNFDKIKRAAGTVAHAFVIAFKTVKDTVRGAINFIIAGWNSLEFKIPGFDPPGPGPKFGGFTLGVPKLPLLATGGIVRRAGAAIVGDRGPELVSLPGAATVAPLPVTEGALAMPFPMAEITTLVQLDKREIARAVGTYTADKLARR